MAEFTHPNPVDKVREPKRIVQLLRKIYHPIGFSRGYNFALFFVFGGAWLGFLLARIQYMNVTGDAKSSYRNGAGPGEWYFFSQGIYAIAIRMHLYTIFPAGMLALLQFVPYIRRTFTLFHRINGYLVLALLVPVNVSALLLARRAFGGSLSTQTFVGTLALITSLGAFLAWFNIKRLRIDQHRAWMLRTWVYIGVVITQRLLFVLIALIISRIGSYYASIPCQQVAFVDARIAASNPACAADSSGMASVKANFAGPGMTAVSIMASFHVSFGAAGWLGLLIHAAAIELYLALTPVETERLRQLSLKRQLERRANSQSVESDAHKMSMSHGIDLMRKTTGGSQDAHV